MLDANGALQQSQVYTDFSGLSKLKSAAKNSDPGAIEAVAGQFEALFLHLMLKSMRDANAVFAEGNYLSSSSVDTYQQMLDQQLSVSLSEGSGLGLKDILVKQLGNITASPEAVAASNKPNEEQKDSSLTRRIPNQITSSIASPLEKHTNADNDNNALFSSQNTAPLISVKNNTSDKVQGFKTTEQLRQAENISKNNALSVSDINKNQRSFIDKLLPIAKKAGGELGLDPKMLVAQAALETGWGKYLVNHPNGSSSFNLFNIKAGSTWQGDTVSKEVVEYRGGISMQQKSQFRAYDSFQDSFNDYVNFIKQNARYSEALEQSHSPEKYMQALHQAGYATDPAYSKKVTHVYQRMDALQGT